MEIGKVRKVAIIAPEVVPGNEAHFRGIAELKRQIDSVNPRVPTAASMLSDLQDRLRSLKAELRFVEVQMDIRMQYLNRISRDSEVAIESRGLIGDSFIQISAGTYGVLPLQRGEFYVIEGVRTTGFREIMTGANDVIANFGVLSDQVKNIAMKINPDKVGSGLAQTIQDMQKTLRHADNTFSHATLLVDDLRKGEGTFGRIVSDPLLYQRLAESADRINKIADALQNGKGTLPRLLNDATLYDSAKETLQKMDSMMSRIESGEGTLGKLSKDQALYDTSKLAIERFSSLVHRMDKGDGTIGKLMRDPSLYNNLNQSTAEITKLIYDLRQDPKKYLTVRFRLF
jgi:phospholipid/cholesterol/gamma-HCH transport system substrate-binding protein